MSNSTEKLNSSHKINMPHAADDPHYDHLGEVPFPNYGDSSKERLRLLLDEPSSSKMAFYLGVFIAVFIVGSSIMTIIETVPKYYKSQEQLWFIFETVIVSTFTVEFLLRLYAHSSSRGKLFRFLRSFYTIIDLLAILPYFISLVLFGNSWSDMQKFTVLRLFRLLRLFRCYNFSSLLQLSLDALTLSLKKSIDALLALAVFICFVMVSFSTMIYFAERGNWDPNRRTFIDINGDPSQFNSIPSSFYFVAEVITTVGLGDIHPKTAWGQALTIPLMMFSLLIIALPSIVVGRNFAESWAWLRSTRPARPSMTITSTASPSSIGGHFTPHNTRTGSPILRGEPHFLAELSTSQLATQIPVDLPRANNRIPLPAPSTSVADHGEVMLGILQELQRQNELLERLILKNNGAGAGTSIVPPSSEREDHWEDHHSSQS